LLDPEIPQTILIVEDNDDDFEAIGRAFDECQGLMNPIYRCRDGQDAWDYLTRDGAYAGTPPVGIGLILLDLNMPGLDGRQFLKRLKSHDTHGKTPCVVMTTSTEDEDIEACYRAGANTYVRKPMSWTEFTNAISRLHEYWFQIAFLPK
jgi:CheY-like chemotaxis protein